MAKKPFDREVWNIRERPLSGDQNQEATYADLELRELLLRQLGARTASSDDTTTQQPPVGGANFIGSAFKARSAATMQVFLDAGLGWFNDNAQQLAIGGVTGLDDISAIKPMTLTATETIAVPAADPSNARIDIIEVRYVATLTDVTSRQVLDPATGIFGATAVPKTLSYNQNGLSTVNGTGPINYKTGTPAATPTAAAVDAGYVKVAEVRVPANATIIGATCIKDLRVLAAPNGMIQFACRVTASLGGGPIPATVSRVAAPPGVVIGARASQVVGNGANLFDLHVVAGGSPSAYGRPILMIDVSDGLASALAPTVRTAGFTVVGASSGSLSSAARSAPTVTLADGQVVWLATIGALSATASTGFATGATATWNVLGTIPVNAS